jgi:GAF domain-containing protein
LKKTSASRVNRESARVEILRSYRVLDTPPEPAFDSIVSLARELFAVPVAGVALVDDRRSWFKAIDGLEAHEMPRADALCELALPARDVVVVPDAAADPRTRDRAMVSGEPGLRFYAAAPLRTAQGVGLGAVFVADRKPGRLSVADRRRLRGLASLAMEQLDLRAALCRIAQTDEGLKDVAEALAMETGEAFITALTRCLTEALGVDYAFVSEVDPSDPAVAHCTICERGNTHRLVDYEFRGTPCAAVIAGEPRCYPKGVCQLFPEDTALVALGAEGYAAVPLFGPGKRPIGLLGVLTRGPLADGGEMLTHLGIFGPRAAAEMGRLLAERGARKSERRRDALLRALPDMVFHIDRAGRYVAFEPGLHATPLVPPEEFLGKRIAEVLPPELARDGMRTVTAALEEGPQVWEYELLGRKYEARCVATGSDEVVCFVRDVTKRG